MVAALPFVAFVRESLGSAVARPSTATGGRYNQVSFEFFTAVHAVMAGEREAARAMEDLEQRLERLRRGGRW
jgi:trehalose/maltose transport system substrate-binding protein